MAGTDAVQPLEGLKVLDFTRHMAGPYATVALSDYGADVIKVETLEGDPSRRTGVDYIGEESSLFLIWNRGKRSISLDLRNPESKPIIERLAREADIVMENFRPGQADKFGIGYEELSKLNDQIVYVSISAFGSHGPLAPFPGTDPVVQAASGIMSVTGEPDRGPSLVGVPVADFTAAMVGFQAVLLGLLARQRTGKGQHIEVSMLEALMSSLTTRLASYFTNGKDPTRFGSAHSVVMPYEAFETADGYAVAGVWGGNDGWTPFCEALGLPELAADTRYQDNRDRIRLREELQKPLVEAFKQKTTAEWQEIFNAAGVLFSPVNTFSDAFGHPQIADSDFVQKVEHPTIGEIDMLGPTIHLEETPGSIAMPPPVLGQHTDQVLAELGYDEEEIRSFADKGIAKDASVAAEVGN
jgi:crotonobetainyl-CoA:carnitine CoA-transferase CaiB-like acyl-CoA transferase